MTRLMKGKSLNKQQNTKVPFSGSSLNMFIIGNSQSQTASQNTLGVPQTSDIQTIDIESLKSPNIEASRSPNIEEALKSPNIEALKSPNPAIQDSQEIIKDKIDNEAVPQLAAAGTQDSHTSVLKADMDIEPKTDIQKETIEEKKTNEPAKSKLNLTNSIENSFNDINNVLVEIKVDKMCPIIEDVEVFVKDDEIFDTTLNVSDIQRNSNHVNK